MNRIEQNQETLRSSILSILSILSKTGRIGQDGQVVGERGGKDRYQMATHKPGMRRPTLTVCPDCGGQVSIRAMACVHCGAPMQVPPPPPVETALAQPPIAQPTQGQTGPHFELRNVVPRRFTPRLARAHRRASPVVLAIGYLTSAIVGVWLGYLIITSTAWPAIAETFWSIFQ